MHRLTRAGIALVCSLIGIAGAPAWGGPPLISDDPHTVGRGNVEAILALGGAGAAGQAVVNAPNLDLTLGIAEGLDLTLVTSPTFELLSPDPNRTTGSLVAGFKWRPIAASHVTAAITPAIGVDFLSGDQFFVTIPIQIEYGRERVAVGVDGGYQAVRNSPDGFNASLYTTFAATSEVKLMAELWALSASVLDGTDFGAGAGLDYTLRDGWSLLAMVGTGIASQRTPRVDWVAYFGVWWAFDAFGDPAEGPSPDPSAGLRRRISRHRRAPDAAATRPRRHGQLGYAPADETPEPRWP